jgi:HAD superfamily hydrolase (TIGR01509 family)
MTRTILFDLGNVLVRFCHERMWRQVGALVGAHGPDLAQRFATHPVMEGMDTGATSLDDLRAVVAAECERAIDAPGFSQAIADIFTPDPTMEALAHSLKARGLRLVLLSNTCPLHIDWLLSSDTHSALGHLLRQFDALVLSYEVGGVKPHEPIYRRALEVIDCDPAECFYTDDLPANIATGKRLGFDAELFTNAANCRRHLRERGIEVE